MDNEKDQSGFEQKKQLFLQQKALLDTFLSKGAITQKQYDKSYGDMVKLMGMGEEAEKLKAEKEGGKKT